MSSLAYTQQYSQSVLSVPIHKALNLTLVSQSPSPNTAEPTAHLSLTTTPIHLVHGNALHGGILSIAIDTACLLALIPTLSDSQTASTIASSFQILNAVPGEGNVCEIVGRMTRRGKTLAFCEGEVRCAGKVVAKGSVTKTIFEPKEKKSNL